MTARDFAYWLQGYFEVAKPVTVDAEAIAMIQKHLDMVFVHDIDPTHGGKEIQQKLNTIHSNKPGLGKPSGLGGAVARC